MKPKIFDNTDDGKQPFYPNLKANPDVYLSIWDEDLHDQRWLLDKLSPLIKKNKQTELLNNIDDTLYINEKHWQFDTSLLSNNNWQNEKNYVQIKNNNYTKQKICLKIL